MEEIIGLLFLDRNLTHLAHLKTDSYSQHKALNKFYEGVIDLADKLAEAYQGAEGIMQDIPLMSTVPNEPIDMTLYSHMQMIEAMRKSACKITAIQNIIDEVVSLYLSTIYKLRNLH